MTRPLSDRFSPEDCDVVDRVVAAVIAYGNGDHEGANAVLGDIDPVRLHDILFALVWQVGELACGADGFRRALLAWRDDFTTSRLRRAEQQEGTS